MSASLGWQPVHGECAYVVCLTVISIHDDHFTHFPFIFTLPHVHIVHSTKDAQDYMILVLLVCSHHGSHMLR